MKKTNLKHCLQVSELLIIMGYIDYQRSQRDIDIHVHYTFIIHNKQQVNYKSKCPSMNEYITKMVYIYI